MHLMHQNDWLIDWNFLIFLPDLLLTNKNFHVTWVDQLSKNKFLLLMSKNFGIHVNDALWMHFHTYVYVYVRIRTCELEFNFGI